MSRNATGSDALQHRDLRLGAAEIPRRSTAGATGVSLGDSAPPSTSGSSSRNCQSTRTGYRCASSRHLVDRERLIPHQRVQPRQRSRAIEVTPEVESGAQPRRHGQARDRGDLVVADALDADTSPACGRSFTPASSIGAVGSTHGAPCSADAATPGDDAFAARWRARPRSPGHAATVGFFARRRRDRSADTNGATRGGSPRRRDRLPAEKHLTHACIVPRGTDTATIHVLRRSARRLLRNVRFVRAAN